MTARTVLDTSVLVSALLLRSRALTWMRGAWQSGEILPLASHTTTKELIRVLAYPKFALNVNDQHDLLDEYLPFCERVVIPNPPPTVPECRDIFDRQFMELALAGNADVLVTSDADLLVLAETLTIPILSPADFERWLTSSRVQ